MVVVVMVHIRKVSCFCGKQLLPPSRKHIILCIALEPYKQLKKLQIVDQLPKLVNSRKER